MVFASGRGRAPISNAIVGEVDWDEKHECWASSNNYYWHGTKQGGWREVPPEAAPPVATPNTDQETPDADSNTDQRSPDVDSNADKKRRRIFGGETKSVVKMPRARPPSGNELVGSDVTYNPDAKCFATDKGYYWHGTFKGGWKTHAPGKEQQNVDLKREMGGVGNTKGRRPGPPNPEDSVTYDTERGRWISISSGLIWLGTYNGGWVQDPAAGKEKANMNTKVISAVERKKPSLGAGNTKGRRPTPPIGGGVVEYSDEHKSWFCTGLGTNKYWHGASKGGWKDDPPAGAVEVTGEVIDDDQTVSEDGTVSEDETVIEDKTVSKNEIA